MKNKLILSGMAGVLLVFILAFTGCPQADDPTPDPTPSNTKVTLTGITGLTVPVTGEVPVTTITETAQYTGTVTWAPAVTGTFAASTPYTAIVALTAKSGYTFTGVAANSFTVLGATVTNGADSGTVSAVFPATGAAAPDFAPSTNDTTANDLATLGLVGTTVGSSAPGVATVGIETGKIKITSVSAGSATITVSVGNKSATIPVTVGNTGSITIGAITKYVETSWAPQNVTVIPGDAEITIRWDAVTDATGYEVYWSLNTNTNPPATPNRSITDGATTFVTYGTTAGIVNNITYNVWMKAKRSSGTSELSAMVSGTPHTADAVPASPINVMVVQTSSGQLRISWDAVPWASGYKVYIGEGPNLIDAVQKGGSLQVPTTTYTTVDLKGDTMYSVWVYAYNTLGSSDNPSAREYAQTLPTPSDALVATTWTSGGGNGLNKIVFAANGRCTNHYLDTGGVPKENDYDYSYIEASETLTLYKRGSIEKVWTTQFEDNTDGEKTFFVTEWNATYLRTP